MAYFRGKAKFNGSKSGCEACRVTSMSERQVSGDEFGANRQGYIGCAQRSGKRPKERFPLPKWLVCGPYDRHHRHSQKGLDFRAIMPKN